MSDYSNLSFADLKVGDCFALGEHRMGRDEIIAFASKYDPQPFHLDDEAARRNPLFKGLSASGWHSMLIVQRMMGLFWESTQLRALAGIGVTDLRWHAPVYPDDRLIVDMTIDEVRRSRSRPDQGIITTRGVARRDGAPVTSFLISGMFAG